MGVCREIVSLEISYVVLSGGEPLLWPGFWQVFEFLTGNGVDLKIETNGQLLSSKTAARLARFHLRSVQVSIDGITHDTYSGMRPGAKLDRALQGIKHLVDEGAVTEIVYVPAKYNLHEVEKIIDWAAEQKVKAFYTGRTMHIGRAVKNWGKIGLSEEETEDLNRRVEAKAVEYRDRMVVRYYPYDLVEELVYRLENPAAIPFLLCDGKVKLLDSMPFVCGDVRKHGLAEIWERYKEGWKRPEVAEYVRDVTRTPSFLARALDLVELNL